MRITQKKIRNNKMAKTHLSTFSSLKMLVQQSWRQNIVTSQCCPAAAVLHPVTRPVEKRTPDRCVVGVTSQCAQKARLGG